MTSYAFHPREPSASASSRVFDISKLRLFLAHPRTEPLDCPMKLYSLDDLASHLKIAGSFDKDLSIQKQNVQLATRCVEAACNNKFHIENKEVMNMKGLKISSLSSLVVSSHERADVIVYDEQHKKLLLLTEVQSSPMVLVFGEKNPVIGAATALRFLRNSDNNFDEFNSFVFLKKGEKQSVMKVTVTWMNFHFPLFPQTSAHPG